MRVGAFASGAWFCLAACAMMAQQTGTPPVSPLPTASRNVTSRSANRTARFRVLDEFSDSVQRLLTDVNPAVVDIVSEGLGEPEESTPGKANALSRQTREGTGVIVSANGDLITNAHVVMSAKR